MGLQLEKQADGFRVLTDEGAFVAHAKTRLAKDHEVEEITEGAGGKKEVVTHRIVGQHPTPRGGWQIRWHQAVVPVEMIEDVLKVLPPVDDVFEEPKAPEKH